MKRDRSYSHAKSYQQYNPLSKVYQSSSSSSSNSQQFRHINILKNNKIKSRDRREVKKNQSQQKSRLPEWDRNSQLRYLIFCITFKKQAENACQKNAIRSQRQNIYKCSQQNMNISQQQNRISNQQNYLNIAKQSKQKQKYKHTLHANQENKFELQKVQKLLKRNKQKPKQHSYFYNRMSKFIVYKGVKQCQSHHQTKIKIYKTVDDIIYILKYDLTWTRQQVQIQQKRMQTFIQNQQIRQSEYLMMPTPNIKHSLNIINNKITIQNFEDLFHKQINKKQSLQTHQIDNNNNSKQTYTDIEVSILINIIVKCKQQSIQVIKNQQSSFLQDKSQNQIKNIQQSLSVEANINQQQQQIDVIQSKKQFEEIQSVNLIIKQTKQISQENNVVRNFQQQKGINQSFQEAAKSQIQKSSTISRFQQRCKILDSSDYNDNEDQQRNILSFQQNNSHQKIDYEFKVKQSFGIGNSTTQHYQNNFEEQNQLHIPQNEQGDVWYLHQKFNFVQRHRLIKFIAMYKQWFMNKNKRLIKQRKQNKYKLLAQYLDSGKSQQQCKTLKQNYQEKYNKNIELMIQQEMKKHNLTKQMIQESKFLYQNTKIIKYNVGQIEFIMKLPIIVKQINCELNENDILKPIQNSIKLDIPMCFGIQFNPKENNIQQLQFEKLSSPKEQFKGKKQQLYSFYQQDEQIQASEQLFLQQKQSQQQEIQLKDNFIQAHHQIQVPMKVLLSLNQILQSNKKKRKFNNLQIKLLPVKHNKTLNKIIFILKYIQKIRIIKKQK